MEQTIKSKFRRELDALATIRDELKLKLHLARKDVQDEVARLEQRLEGVDAEMERVKTRTVSDAEKLGADFKQLLTELHQGYENVKRKLS